MLIASRRRTYAKTVAGTVLLVAAGTGVALAGSPAAAAPVTALAHSPIKHVVIIYQENHSFDETLGSYCQQRASRPCDGYTGRVHLKDGTVVPLTHSPDLVPDVNHSVASQETAVDSGAMDGWAEIGGCRPADHYGCLTYYNPGDVPNLTNLADRFVVSDRTFSMADSPSWGGHLYAAAGSLDGFDGSNPGHYDHGRRTGPGWGCDSGLVTPWTDPTTGIQRLEPSCVPFPDGSGAFRTTPVPWVPTIFDSLENAGLNWHIYGAPKPTDPNSKGAYYVWSICPSVADCLETDQVQNLVPSTRVLTDAARGQLPSYSIVTPSGQAAQYEGGQNTSQHNLASMTAGDNWIGDVVSAIEHGPDWNSTAIFITYDDCGCFYDHVPPGVNPDGTDQGTRVPMVIVSPYAVAGRVDSHPATFASILAFTEATLGLPALSANDAHAYDYANAFDFSRSPTAPIPMVHRVVPAATTQWLESHPAEVQAAAEDDT